MEKKTCPKCRQSDHTDFLTCRFCGWKYDQVPTKEKSGEGFDFGSFLRNGGLIVVLVAASWTAKPLINNLFHYTAGKTADKIDVEIEKADAELEENPRNLDALLKRAHGYYDIGEMDAAAEDYHNAVKLFPDQARVYRERAAFYEAMGDAASAKKDKEQADRMGK